MFLQGRSRYSCKFKDLASAQTWHDFCFCLANNIGD